MPETCLRAVQPATGKTSPNSPSADELARAIRRLLPHGALGRIARRLGREPRWAHDQMEQAHPLSVDFLGESSHEVSDADARDLAQLEWEHRGLIVGIRPEPGSGSTLAALGAALKEVGDVAQLAPELVISMDSMTRTRVQREALEARHALDLLLRTLGAVA